jgi:hypothetical protein
MTFKLPELVVTNPLWIWLFRHGIEDPGWGKSTIGQHTIALAILDIAERINDPEIQKQVKASASKLLLDTAQAIAQELRPAE